jgi:hypothetical protein
LTAARRRDLVAALWFSVATIVPGGTKGIGPPPVPFFVAVDKHKFPDISSAQIRRLWFATYTGLAGFAQKPPYTVIDPEKFHSIGRATECPAT